MTGAAAPLVLVHGVGLDRTMWTPFTLELARRDPREVIELDLPGHGGRPPLTAPTSLAEMSADVASRLPGRCHLMGFSLGALICQHIARFSASEVASLICISSVCARTPEESEAVTRRLETALADFGASARSAIERWFPRGTGAKAELIDQIRTVLLSNDVDSYLHAYRVFATADAEIAAELPRISAPTLAITGSDDPGSTPDMSRRLADAVPGGRKIIVDDARHMLPVERPAELAGHVVAFLHDQERGAT